MQSTDTASAVLANDRVRLAFEPRCFCPIHLVDARAPEVDLFSLMAVQYVTNDGATFTEAWAPGKPQPDKGRLFDLVSSSFSKKGSTQLVHAKSRSPHFTLTKTFTLRRGEPWVRVRYSLVSRGTHLESRATQIQVPAMWYGPRPGP